MVEKALAGTDSSMVQDLFLVRLQMAHAVLPVAQALKKSVNIPVRNVWYSVSGRWATTRAQNDMEILGSLDSHGQTFLDLCGEQVMAGIANLVDMSQVFPTNASPKGPIPGRVGAEDPGKDVTKVVSPRGQGTTCACRRH